MKIEENLNEIFKKKSGIDFIHDGKLQGEKLFGEIINLPERELVYVLLDVQRRFGIIIPKNAIIERRFTTFSNIVEIIAEQLMVENVTLKF